MDSLKEKRILIDAIDSQIIDLLQRRFQVVSEIKEIKKANNIQILDSSREKTILDNILSKCDNKHGDNIAEIYKTIMNESKKNQH